MSGGMWNYEQVTMESILLDIACDIREDFPELGKKLNILANRLYVVANELDKHYSGDALIKDMDRYEEKTIKLLKRTMEKADG